VTVLPPQPAPVRPLRDDASRELAFSADLARLFQRVLVGPTLLASIAVVGLSPRPTITLAWCFSFLAAQWSLSVYSRLQREHNETPSPFLPPLRLAASMTLLPGVVLSGGVGASGWLVAVPAVFAHTFLAGTQPRMAWVHCFGVLLPTLASWAWLIRETEGKLVMSAFVPAFIVLTSTIIVALPTVQEIWDRWWRAYEASAQFAELNDSLRDYQDQLLQTVQRADGASHAKSNFLAHMSHELRTPMNGVLGSIDLLALEDLSPSQAELIDNARKSARSMLRLLNDLLDLSKVEAGRMELESTSFSVRQLVDEVMTTLGPLAGAGVRFASHVDPLVPDRVVGDPTRLRQVLINLASNALKFTHEGAVMLFANTAEAPTRTHVQLVFEVRDTGIGIDPTRLPSLFDAYTQADASVTRRYGGTGLGLALVRELVQLMGGTVRAQSAVGQGSAFVVTLPFALVGGRRAEVAVRATTAQLPEARTVLEVLVVDDNATNRLVAVKMLERMGHQVRVAPDGLAAIESFKTHGAHVILMDCFMPRLDGFGATQRIREMETGAKVPIIGITASTSERDLRQCRRSGMNGVLSKPFDAGELTSALRRYVGRNRETEPEPEDPEETEQSELQPGEPDPAPS
jgi:signal transduction histidine kinase/CheY-like chemotaxis protein